MTINLKDPAEVMARTCWGEARGQGRIGLLAVACVIWNRAEHPRWWGHDVISVCLEPAQFSCWNTNDPNRKRLLAVTSSDPDYQTALEVSGLVLSGGQRDVTLGADSYYAISIDRPGWCARGTFTVQIGAHRFYRIELPAPGTATPANPHGVPAAPPISCIS